MKNYWLDKKKVQEEKEKFKGLFQEPAKYGYYRPRRFNLMPKAFYYPKT
jgi:hypothetical protein